MKKRPGWLSVFGVFLIIFLMNGAAIAQRGPVENPIHDSDIELWTYDTPIGWPEVQGFTGQEAIVTERGTVKKIEPMMGHKNSQQMRFLSESGGNWIVYMGPKWFVDNQKIKFNVGDKVEVRGKKFGGAIIASQISKGQWTMKLRNEQNGQANWQCCFPYKEKQD
ncbi:MAG: hypothetical protein ABFD50_12815 [Smithella sp.]